MMSTKRFCCVCDADTEDDEDDDNGACKQCGVERAVVGFINYYRHCGTKWSDQWSCMCNDECPRCGGEIEPYDSDELREEAP
jgi:hypothetical protein